MELFSLLLENVKQAKDFLTKRGIDPNTDHRYLEIRTMLNGNDGYTYWFVAQHFGNGTSIEELKNIWNIIQQEKSTIVKFQKPITKLETVEEFWDEYYKQKNLSKARSAFNKFMREQKILLDFNNETDRKLLDALADRKDADQNFFNKSQRYHTRKDLINAIRLFLEARTDTEFGRLLSELEKDGQDIRYHNIEKNIIIICVDYSSLKKWGGDTSWCIVPSKSTFDSYNSRPMSQQFIIFLTDETGNRSKIGVTTNINGYQTAHYKNDAYCSQKDLSEILKERGTRFGILLPSKESIREIKDWNQFPVENLKQMGFSNDEILSRKTLFNTGQTRGDLQHFTSEEIEKWKLLDKTQLYPDDLKPYTPKEIEKKELWKRLRINSISELKDLNLDYPLIRKICIFNTEKGGSLKSDFLSGMIANLTRSNIIKSMRRSHWLSYVDKDKKYHTSDTRESSRIKIDLVDLLKMDEKEMTTDELCRVISDFIGKREDQSGLEKIRSIMDGIEKRGRSVSDDLFLKIVENNTGYGRWIIRLSELVSENIRREFCYTQINRLIEASQKSTTVRYSGTSDDLRQFDLNSSDLKKIQTDLNNEETYQRIFNITKSIKMSNPEKLKMVNDEGRGYGRETSIEKTLNNIDFFSIKLKLKDFFNLFSWIGIRNLNKLLKYLKDRGYDLSDENELVKGADEIKSTHDEETDTIIEMIKCGVAVEKNYQKLIDWVKGRKTPITQYEKSKLEEIFKKKDEYYKKWQSLHSLDSINESLTSLLSSTKWWSGSKYGTEMGLEEWFEKYWDIIKDYSWEDQYEKRKDYEHKYFNALIQVLAKIGKKKELMGLKNDRLIQGANFGQDGIKNLCKIIADKYIVNGDRAYRKMVLTDDERRLIFEWLDKQVDEKTKKDIKDPRGWGHIYATMAVAWYLFDREKLWRYIDRVLTLKNNYHHTDWITNDQGKSEMIVKKTSTIRLKELSKLLPFLAEDGHWDDLKKILKMFGETKMSKTEWKESMGYLLNYNFFSNSRTEKDRKEGKIRSEVRDFSTQTRDKFKKLLAEYIPEPTTVKKVKESRIITWKDFRY